MTHYQVTHVETGLKGRFEGDSKQLAVHSAYKKWIDTIEGKSREFTATRITKPKKPIVARKEYTCSCCLSKIAKGDGYFRKNVRIGSSKPDTLEMKQGIPWILSHGYSVSEKICVECEEK